MTIKQAVEVLKHYHYFINFKSNVMPKLPEVNKAFKVVINHLQKDFDKFKENLLPLKHGKKGSNTKKGAKKEVKREAKKAPKSTRKR